MKFKTTPYHFDLLKDKDRVASFYEAIKEYDLNKQLAYDLGCGSGILSYFLSLKFQNVVSIEIDRKAYQCAKQNLSEFPNINVINNDVMDFDFKEKADLIVCEMLDTALIDEEQIPVLNHAKKYLKENGSIIPQSVINTAQLVNMEREYIHWDESGVKYNLLSDEVLYSEFNFLDDINPNFESEIKFETSESGIVNGIRITTFTKLTENLILGPSPMFNPPLLIPLEDKQVNRNDFINVKLKYIMGNGIESIESEYV